MNRPGIQSPTPHGRRAASGNFATTQWSVVQAAGGTTNSSIEALEELCRTYWYPLYAYVRRRGYQISNAQDLTQGFIASLLQRQTIGRADPDRGRFRSYLLGCFNLYLSDEQQRQSTQKRGGNRMTLSIDTESAECWYQLEPMDSLTPEDIFERRWALTVLETAAERLKTEYSQSGRLNLFDALRSHLGADKESIPHRQIAADLGMQEGAVKTAAHRLRRRFRAALRFEIAQTVASSEDLEAELQQLFHTLSRH